MRMVDAVVMCERGFKGKGIHVVWGVGRGLVCSSVDSSCPPRRNLFSFVFQALDDTRANTAIS